jgi:hypothetical protein
VEPKRQALFQANVELAAAQEKLSIIKRKVTVSVLCLIVSSFAFFNKQIHWALP